MLCATGVDSHGNEMGQNARSYAVVGLHNPGPMTSTYSPKPMPTATQVAVTANATGATVNGTVSINGAAVGQTGHPFQLHVQTRR